MSEPNEQQQATSAEDVLNSIFDEPEKPKPGEAKPKTKEPKETPKPAETPPEEPAAAETTEDDDEPKRPDEKGPPTPAQLRHYRQLDRRRVKLERKEQAIAEREKALEERTNAAAAKQHDLETLVNDFVEGDLEKKIAVTQRVKNLDLPALYKKLSLTGAGVQEPKTEAEIAKIIAEVVQREIAPLKTAKEEAEKAAKAERDRAHEAEKENYVAKQIESIADSPRFPALSEYTALVGKERAFQDLWNLGITMVEEGRKSSDPMHPWKGIDHRNAHIIIADRANEWLLNGDGKQILEDLRRKAGKTDSPGAGTRTTKPATSLSAGQASQPSPAARPLTDEERETAHKRHDPDAVIAEWGIERRSVA